MKLQPTRKALLIWGFLLLGVIISVIFIYWWKVRSEVVERKEIKKEQERLDGILAEINDLYILNDELKNQWEETDKEQREKNKEYNDKKNWYHSSAEMNREEIKRLWDEYYKDKEEGKVMSKICELSKDSPMCGDYVMLVKLKNIADERGVDYKLLLGIMYAESHIWAYFNQENCRQTNNWWGVKNRKYDNGVVSEKFSEQYKNLTGKNLEGCRLYYFDDVYTFFESLANTISLGYAKCNEDVYCIMGPYVGHESGAWVRNVYLFKAL